MANQITDNRTLVHAADVVTPYDSLAGGASGTLDTEIFIQGTGSIGQYTSNTRGGLLFDAGAAQNWSNNVFYLWINCGIVGLLDTKANGGLTIRFAGATVTNWFEVFVAGSDDWPPSVQGGWTQFVVDIETARATAITNGWTSGTVPATSAIRYVGYSAVTGGTMPRMVDNTWLDEIRRLPDGSPGIIVEGRNGGATPWDSADIFTQLGASVGTFIPSAGGAWKINTPIQFGINDTTTHEFLDTNAVWLWDDQEFMPDDVYAISALGNAGGTTNVTFGNKSGTGGDATGSQGLVISAESIGARWSMDFDDPNLDLVGLYGCSFQHFTTFQLDDPAVEVVSTLYIDGQQAQVANSLQVRNSIIAADTVAGAAFMITDDMGDIIRCSFEFSAGHAIELNAATPTSQNNVGNSFSGYTNTVDSTNAAILNSAAGSLTISSSAGSNLQTNSYRNTGGGGVTILNNISVTLTGLRDNTEVRILDNTTGEFLAGIENATAGTVDDRSFTFSLAAATVVDIAVFNLNFILPPNNRIENFAIPVADTSIPLSQIQDRVFLNP